MKPDWSDWLYAWAVWVVGIACLVLLVRAVIES